MYRECLPGAQIIFPESGRGLGHVTLQFLAVRSAILATAWLLVRCLFRCLEKASEMKCQGRWHLQASQYSITHTNICIEKWQNKNENKMHKWFRVNQSCTPLAVYIRGQVNTLNKTFRRSYTSNVFHCRSSCQPIGQNIT